MAFDDERGVVVLFGGNQGGGEPYCGDTWEYDGTEWTERIDSTPPSAREGAAAAYDATSERECVVLFGGYDSTYKQDTWTWDGTAGDWTLESSSGPSARYQHALAYCGKVLLFGGLVGGNENRQTYDYGADLTPEWACCFADGSCQEMAEAHCLGAGGASWREGETCSSCAIAPRRRRKRRISWAISHCPARRPIRSTRRRAISITTKWTYPSPHAMERSLLPGTTTAWTAGAGHWERGGATLTISCSHHLIRQTEPTSPSPGVMAGPRSGTDPTTRQLQVGHAGSVRQDRPVRRYLDRHGHESRPVPNSTAVDTC